MPTEQSADRPDPLADLHAAARGVQARLTAAGETVAVAETTCGGLVSYALGNAEGPCPWFRAGVIAYSNDAKRDLAGVPADVLATSGAVSDPVALALARGVRERFGVTWGIAETGIAGPLTGRRTRKSAGTVVLAVVGGRDDPREFVVHVQSGLDDRVANKRAFAVALLQLLSRILSSTTP